ncbi:S26 family signal peptidase [Halobaculum sp. CBA1158]|uniref:S26 family signal peptidase n=1 Tax=Halobaculum sp. CBA1158 TaxID=2904243 RepID=UPI001F254B95|nr:S26 family signal peptidase [Halobaculum sp. CBA1158]UIO99801.1 S26 family signal peptidase [Halobaculum sp. CBA1158]
MSDDGRRPDDPLSRFLNAETGTLLFIREVLSSALAVALVGLILFAVSGVWPPMVAVESGSMEPHMERGDLVFITDPDRFSPEFAHEDTGVVTYETGVEQEYGTFGDPGSVIVYRPPGEGGPPIIHRARLHVEEGENWVDRADPDHLPADSCDRVPACPAPYDGFITKGDANSQYDQVSGIAPVVRADWIHGVARVRIPYLGYVRLIFSEAVVAAESGTAAATSETAASPGTAPATADDGRPAVAAPSPSTATTGPSPSVPTPVPG